MRGALPWLASVAVVLTCHAERPNIVIILADDLGYGDVGVCNPDSKIPTPHIDRLASEGMLFIDAHAASSTCTPSRYGLLTGINPARTGVLNTTLQQGIPIIAGNEPTLGAFLQEQGYTTRMLGKWHLGFEGGKAATENIRSDKPLAGGPLDRGFESFFGIPSSPGEPPLCLIRDRALTGAEDFHQEQLSPSLCREAVGMIHAHAKANTGKPLFLYYASPLPHKPWVPTKEFQGKSGAGDYGDFVMQFDDVVGRIAGALREAGLDKNTLLIFTSDNGPSPPAVESMRAIGHDSAGGLRGQKSDAWEGGHRVPMIVRWPGHVPAGTRSKALVNATDLFATIAGILDSQPCPTAVDSVSFLPILTDPAATHLRPPMVTARHAIRHANWKLLSTRRHVDAGELKLSDFNLYDLDADLPESTDLLAAHRAQADPLFTAFQQFTKERVLKVHSQP